MGHLINSCDFIYTKFPSLHNSFLTPNLVCIIVYVGISPWMSQRHFSRSQRNSSSPPNFTTLLSPVFYFSKWHHLSNCTEGQSGEPFLPLFHAQLLQHLVSIAILLVFVLLFLLTANASVWFIIISHLITCHNFFF